MTQDNPDGLDRSACSDGDLYAHEWQPVSFVFETQLLDNEGRVLIRQPDLTEGRVYLVCMKCHKHTYMKTEWAGFYHARQENTAEQDEFEPGSRVIDNENQASTYTTPENTATPTGGYPSVTEEP